MTDKERKRLESEFRIARGQLVVALCFALTGLLTALLMPSLLTYGWIGFVMGAFGTIGWIITMLRLKAKLNRA